MTTQAKRTPDLWKRDGNFLDELGACKVCDGEIPDGHADNCDIWKLEKKHRDFIANEYNAVLIDRDAQAARIAELHGQVGQQLSIISTLEAVIVNHRDRELVYATALEKRNERIAELEAALNDILIESWFQ